MVELLFPVVPGSDLQPASHRISLPSAAPRLQSAATGLGRAVVPSQPDGAGIHLAAERAPLDGVPAHLCAGTEPSGVSVVALEAARTAELLPTGLGN